jgi:ABC-type Na+ transport system ATPase subunit NatA
MAVMEILEEAVARTNINLEVAIQKIAELSDFQKETERVLKENGLETDRRIRELSETIKREIELKNNAVKSPPKMNLDDILKLRGKYAGDISVERFLEQKREENVNLLWFR